MRTFKDTEARDWTVTINVDVIKRVRGLMDVNLLTVLENKYDLLRKLSSDPILLVDVLYCLCKPQADERKITDVQFGQSMSGDSIWNGFNALIDELMDFFPDPRQRTILKELIEKMRSATGILMEHGKNVVEGINPSDVLKTLKNSSGNSPESSASTPDL